MIRTSDKLEDRVSGRHPEHDNDSFKRRGQPVESSRINILDHQSRHLKHSSKHYPSEFHRSNYNDHKQPFQHLWKTGCPENIKEEWLVELDQVLSDVIGKDDLFNLLNYCLYWHPSFPRNEMCYTYYEEDRLRCILNPAKLANTLCAIGSQWDVLRLLYDRGPDFGITLLFVLELLFQAAFCLKKPPRHTQTASRQDLSESRKNLSLVVVHAPRLIELLSLHLDCPPLWPNFRVKFGLVITGLVYHRKLPTASQPRFFQLLYFACPASRQIAMAMQKCSSNNEGKSEKEDLKKHKSSSPFEKSKLIFPDFENYLWHKARSISLGQPDEEAINKIRKRRCPVKVSTRLDAMAFVFERLDHLARALFGSSLCLYGSSATGFATQTSDVDVVLRLSEAGINEMLEEAKYWRSRPDGIDLNCFPFMSLSGPSEMVSDWAWLETKEPAVSASIWAGRKFAWAAYRLFGWRGQCVQSAYVPIVKILACIDSNGLPVEVPNIFTPAAPIDSSLGALLGRMSPNLNFEISEVTKSSDEHENLNRVLDAMRVSSGYHHWSLESWESQLAKLVAGDVVAERQYSSWSPSFSPRVDESLSCFLLRNEFGDENEVYHSATDEQSNGVTLKEARFFHLKLAEEYLRDENMRIQVSTWSDEHDSEESQNSDNEAQQNYFNCCRTSPALLHPKPSTEMDDGRLSPFDKVSDKEIWLVDCDFSMSRQVGIHNSRLLRAYATCDPRVLALGLLIKHWAAANKIEGAYAGFLSGYQWTLLVIHFLQHYSCLKVPHKLQATAAWREYQNVFQAAQLTVPNTVPILPNLQHPPTYVVPKPEEKKPLYIKEIEGDVDVFFFEPHIGFNCILKDETIAHKDESASSLSAVSGGDKISQRKRKRQDPGDKNGWPEDSLLQKNPFLYAYSLLRAPFSLHPNEAQDYCRENFSIDEEGSPKERTSKQEENRRLWLSRLNTAPRPNHKPLSPDGEGSNTRTADKIWDATRSNIKRVLVQSKSENSQQSSGKGSYNNNNNCSSSPELARESFPALSPLRGVQFLKDHLMNRDNLLVDIPTKEVTLTELLYAFFEYYGFRFNYATEMLDIDKVPLVPAGKKEFFKTSIFTPFLDGIHPAAPEPQSLAKDMNVPILPGNTKEIVCAREGGDEVDDLELQSSDSGDKEILDIPCADPAVDSAADDQNPLVGTRIDKEVIGRGNGPFQFRGRHFICLRDPFEKLRTIGPPHRCQTHISAAFLSALHLFRDALSETHSQRSFPILSRLFSTGVRMKLISCPVRELLAHYVRKDDTKSCDRYGFRYSQSELFPVSSEMMRMYCENINTINYFGRYKPLIEEVFNLPMRRDRSSKNNTTYNNNNNNNDKRGSTAAPGDLVSDEDLDSPQIPTNGRKSNSNGGGSRRGSHIFIYNGEDRRLKSLTEERNKKKLTNGSYSDNQNLTSTASRDPKSLPQGEPETEESTTVRNKVTDKWKFKDYPDPIPWLEKQTGIKRRDKCIDPLVVDQVLASQIISAGERNMKESAKTSEFNNLSSPAVDFDQHVTAGLDFNRAEETLRSLNILCRPPLNEKNSVNGIMANGNGGSLMFMPAKHPLVFDNRESSYQTSAQGLKRNKEKFLLNLIQGNVDPRQLDHELALANGSMVPHETFEPRNLGQEPYAENAGLVVTGREEQQLPKNYPPKYHGNQQHGQTRDQEGVMEDDLMVQVNSGSAHNESQTKRNQRALGRSLGTGSSHGRRFKRRGSL